MLQISGVGRLGRDPEMKYTPQGTAVTNFSVAVDTGYGDNKATAWVNLSAFGGLAETANKYLAKGKRIWFVGEIKPDKETGNPRTYERKDGTVAALYEAKMTHMQFIDGSNQVNEPEEF